MSTNTAMMMSPMRSQPTKKQRSGATPASRQARPPISVEADDAIARRRAELRRLQQQRSKNASSSSTTIRPKATPATELLGTTDTKKAAAAPQPPTRNKPPTGAVARKLEYSNKTNKKPAAPPPPLRLRAKSVPPRRPPPPPTASSTTTKRAKETKKLPPTTTTATTRPVPVSAASLLQQQAAPPKQEEEPPTQDRYTKLQKENGVKNLMQEEISPRAFQEGPPKLLPETAKTPAPTEKVYIAQELKTPESISSTTVEPPSTVRRDRIQQLRQGLDSPTRKEAAPPISSIANERLERALKLADQEKNQAFQKIKDLEEKLATSMMLTPKKSNSTPIKDMASLEYAFDMAKEQGQDAAIQWANEQLQIPSTSTKVGFLSPAIPTTPTPRQRKPSTPHPNRHGITKSTKDGKVVKIADEELERRFIEQFREAVQYVPHEFISKDKLVYYVRRPYGIPPQSDIFDCVCPMPHEEYSKRAHVSDPTSMDVAVRIPCDDSVLCLFGKLGARYRITPTGTFETLSDAGTKLLGKVQYIDDTANEQEYDLDQILEEAVSVREQYCSTMMTTALGFSQRKPPLAPQSEPSEQPPKPQTNEIGVDTADIPFPPVPKEVTVDSDKKKQAEKSKEKPKEKQQAAHDEDEDDSGAADVLTIFIGIVLKSIFGFLWWLVIGLPIATIKTSVTYLFAFAILGIVYSYSLNEHHGTLLQGDESFLYTSQYHVNAAGIL